VGSEGEGAVGEVEEKKLVEAGEWGRAEGDRGAYVCEEEQEQWQQKW
jgi:hypothetical protein